MSSITDIKSKLVERIVNGESLSQSDLASLAAHNVTTAIEWITPDKARELLLKQHKNRNLNKKFVDYLAGEIINGNWKITNQGIGLDSDGVLVDGQHRLAAVVKADQGIWISVTLGVTRETALTAVDQGVARSRGSLLNMRGESNAMAKAAICRVVSLLQDPDIKYAEASSPTTDLEVLNEYRSQIEEVIQTTGKYFTSNFHGVAVVLLAKLPDKGRAFLTGVVSGAGLAADDPRFVLRESLLRKQKHSSNLDRISISARAIMASQMFLTDQPFKARFFKLNSMRYIEWCKLTGLPINKSLFGVCGGSLLPVDNTSDSLS